MNGNGASPFRLARAFTPTQQRIGAGIVAGLSYRDMGKELGISEHTVRAQVISMHRQVIGLEDLPPRWGLYVFFKFAAWTAGMGR